MADSKTTRKIALMGFRSVGKSSLAIQFVQGQFVDHYEPTIENTFNKKVTLNKAEYELLLVDTAGQDEYSRMPPEYSIDVHGYVLVYGIDSAKSFEVCRVLHEKLVDLIGADDIPIVLVANKCDLPAAERKVKRDEGQKLADEIKAVFVETSAKTNLGVSDVFNKALARMEGKSHEASANDPNSKGCILS